MEIVKYIKEFGVEALTEKLGIKVRPYPEFGVSVFNYDQIASPKMHPVVQEARALILDDDLNVVSRTFPRFFNYGEADTGDFDFSDCSISIKEDGSLIPIWFCESLNRWCIATRSMAFAEGPTLAGPTFEEAVLYTLGLTDEEFEQRTSEGLSRGATYVFEYTSPLNRIVTPYTEGTLCLLSAFDNETGAELNYSASLSLTQKVLGEQIRSASFLVAKNAQEVVDLVENMDGLREGVVVRNNVTGQRIKVKNALYVKVHHLRGNDQPSRNKLAELVSANEQEEFLTYFPEYQHLITPLEERLNAIKVSAKTLYEEAKLLESQKEYALKVKDNIASSVLFTARKVGCFEEAWASAKLINYLLEN